MTLLTVDALSIALYGGTPLVEGVSFHIGAGETFALLGESGCGKSLTALALMRLLPDGIGIGGGRIELAGRNLLELPERAMCAVRGCELAMIFQEPGLSLNPVLTVGQQIDEVLILHHGMTRTAARRRSIELLRQVGIPDAERRHAEYPFQMSGGMKQRVMIAMALAGEPRLLIADEPTTALDVTIQAQVLQLLRELQQQRGMALLLITHDLAVVAQHAERVAVMYAGRIVEMAMRAELFARPLHPYTRKLFAALPEHGARGRRLAAIPGNVPSPGSALAGCRFAPRCEQAWELCHSAVPEWVELAPGRGVACHLYRTGQVPMLSVAPEGAATEEVTETAISAPLLEVIDLKVHFPLRKGVLQRVVGRVRAVDGVSLELAAGRTLALVGESGCGKTTVGKALLQLVRPSGGQVRFAGMALLPRFPPAARAGMQMVFQDPYASLDPRMRVADILQEGMDALHIGRDSTERQQHIAVLLEQVGLPQSAKWRYPHEFSGGQRQRIAIARALAVHPRLLICDEPTSALDVSVQAQILNLLHTLQQDLHLSYLFITHNLAVVEYLAHEVCVMYLGRIVERGTVEQVMQGACHPYTQALLAAMPRIGEAGRQELRLAGELPSPAAPPHGCHFHPRCPQALPVCRSSYPMLREVKQGQAVACHLFSDSPPL